MNDSFNLAILFEILFLICFALSWPVNIAKGIKSKTTLGKSIGFEYLVLCGYIFGILSKVINYVVYDTFHYSMPFYFINITLVIIDIAIYRRNLKLDKAAGRIS